jgi:RNA polymerase sigma-70 factor, ECF subfamily
MQVSRIVGHEMDDMELRDALIRRDPDSLRTAVDRYGARVHGIVRRVLIDEALAEDVVQETFMALWVKPERFDPRRGGLAAYLCTVARSKAIDHVRREERSRRNSATLDLPSEPSAEPISDDRRLVLDAIARLSYLQREALFLAYFRGLTYREVASFLKVPEGTAKTRLRDALRALRLSMADAASV